MYNQCGTARRYNNNKILGGIGPGDYNSHKTLFAGPDPADKNRVLIRKLVQTSDNVWCFEESRISAAETEGAAPSVHTTLHRLGNTDINEKVDTKENLIRLQYRPMPSVVGFSLFTRPWANSTSSSYTVVENTLTKGNMRWSEWWRDQQDRRDIASYLKLRWSFN